MEDKNLEQENLQDEPEVETKAKIHVNDYGATKDSAVVIEEETRTVFLDEDETIVIEKDKMIESVPKNRPRKVYAGMWGSPEIAVVGIGLLTILAMILLWVFVVIPKQRELSNNRATRDDLEKKLQTAKNRYGSITSTEEQVTKILVSVNDFETRFLQSQSNSRLALYQRINGLISAYGLINTTGPDYAPLEVNDPNARQQQQEGGRARFISIFPGDYVTMTVEGSYQNLRGFISQIEQSNEFIVISAVELEPSENKEKENNDQTQATQAGLTNTEPQSKVDRGKMQGETVTLRLELASYYRRPNFNPQPLETSAVQ